MNRLFVSGFGASHSERIRPYATIDLTGIRALVDEPASVDKLHAQWFIPSTLPTRTFKEQEAHGEFWMLWADLDQEPLALEAVADLIRPLGRDYEIYTSRSATVEVPKCRILIPLSKPLFGKRWSLCQEIFNDLLEAGGAIPDRANERCGQLCFLPNRGEYYETVVRRHDAFFDPLTVWANEIQVKEERLQAQEEEVHARRVAALERKASLSLGREPTLIEAFNDSYPVEEVLLRAGYDQRGNRFRHPNSESGSFSASVQDGRVHTLSTADPLYTNGQGAHDAFSAFTVLFAEGDSSRALKQAGEQMVMIGSESWNTVKQREYAITHPPPEIDISGLLMNGREEPKASSAESRLAPIDPDEPCEPGPEKFTLHRFALNGSSAELEAQMLDDIYVMGRLAILGQSTAIYAPPNAGKTLITLALIIQAIEAGGINGQQLFYINADDNFKGLVTKLKLAEQHGFQLLAPDHNKFKLCDFTHYLTRLVNDQTAWGAIVILDTVKKFTDIMNKRVVSEFGKVIRSFVQAGGTVIMLAHVNKHRDDDDKPVAAGTSDIIDDADCAYILDTVEHGFGEFLATFENKKARGDVVPKVTYRFMRHSGQEYSEILASVAEVGNEELSRLAKEEVLRESQQKHGDLIERIRELIEAGTNTKTDIIAAVQKETKQAREKIRKVLEIHTGDSYLMGHHWQVTGGKHNAQIYTVLHFNQRPSMPIDDAETAEQARANQASHTTANPANAANPITTGVLASANRMANSANSANPIVIVLGANNATTINTCKLAYRLLTMDDDHVAISPAMAEYLKAKGRIDGLGDHHG